MAVPESWPGRDVGGQTAELARRQPAETVGLDVRPEQARAVEDLAQLGERLVVEQRPERRRRGGRVSRLLRPRRRDVGQLATDRA